MEEIKHSTQYCIKALDENAFYTNRCVQKKDKIFMK
jgi:hypothetical protein